jgi:hypothetical protein
MLTSYKRYSNKSDKILFSEVAKEIQLHIIVSYSESYRDGICGLATQMLLINKED